LTAATLPPFIISWTETINIFKCDKGNFFLKQKNSPVKKKKTSYSISYSCKKKRDTLQWTEHIYHFNIQSGGFGSFFFLHLFHLRGGCDCLRKNITQSIVDFAMRRTRSFEGHNQEAY
jgi:hypothetical protein